MQNRILKGSSLAILALSILVIAFAVPVTASAALSASCSANPSPATVGQTVTFTANVSGGNNTYAYTWSGDCVGNSPTCTNIFSAAGDYSTTLKVVSDNQMMLVGCPVSVGQTQTPNLTVSATANPNSALVNQAVTFNSNVSGGNNVYSYSWTGDCTGSSSSCSNPSGFNSVGTYTATLRVNSGNQSVIAYASVTVNPVVIPPPPPQTSTLTVSASANPNPASVNQNVTFTANVSGGNNSYTYTWSGDCNGNSPTCTNIFSVAGSYSATLRVVSGNQLMIVTAPVTVNAVNNYVAHSYLQCSSNNVYWYDSNSARNDLYQACNSNQTCQSNTCVTTQTPTLTVSATANPNPASVNQIVTFTANVSGGNNSYTYSWSGDCSGSSSTCTNAFNTAGNYSATLRVISGSQSMIVTATVAVNAVNNYIAHSYLQCSSNNVYWYDSNSARNDVYQVCGANQYCSGNTCVNNGGGNNYIAHSYTQCSGNGVYWYDSNGSRNDLYQVCGSYQTCSGNSCVNNNYNYGYSHAYTQCSGNNIYWYDSNGQRQDIYRTCQNSYNDYSNYCTGNVVYRKTINYVSGCANNSCYSTPVNYGYNFYNNVPQYVKTCSANQICSAGACITKVVTPTYIKHNTKECSGNSIYWFDSNNVQQDVYLACSANQSCTDGSCINNPEILGLALTLFGKKESEAVQWSKNFTLAGNEKADFLLVVSNGTDKTMDNVNVKIELPSQLTYIGELKIDGVVTTGDIRNGIALGSLQTKTTKAITFKAQAVSDTNFNADSVNVTGTVTTSQGTSTDLLTVAFLKNQQTENNTTADNNQGWLASFLGAGLSAPILLLGVIIIILILLLIKAFRKKQD